MRRLRRSIRQLRPRLGALALVVCVIALGIALAAGMLLATRALTHGIERSVGALAGRSDVQVLPQRGSSFEEALLERVRVVSGVTAAAPLFSNTAASGDGSGRLVRVIGVDMLDEATTRVYEHAPGEAAGVEDPLIFLSQSDSILVPASFAREEGLTRQGQLVLQAPHFPVCARPVSDPPTPYATNEGAHDDSSQRGHEGARNGWGRGTGGRRRDLPH